MNTENPLKKAFHGTIDELLAKTSQVSDEAINEVDGDYKMNHVEAVEYVMNEFHVTKEAAEKAVVDIQLEEFERIADGLVQKGVLEVIKYNEDGSKEYGVVGE